MVNKIRRTILVVLSLGILALLLIQLIPYGRNHDNPPVVSEPSWDSPQTRELAKRACFDCHSNETVWPWYSNIAPASWLVYRDAVQARYEFNFSDWNTSPLDDGEEIAEVIYDGEMPPMIYLLAHPDARLSQSEKETLVTGLVSTISR